MNNKGKVAMFGAIFLAALLLLMVVVAKPGTRARKACNDGIDNDGDGYTDWPSDPGCAYRLDTSELNPGVECDDGSDNDGDGNIDTADSGCTGPTDTDESDCGDSVCEGGELCDICVSDCGYCNTCNDTDGGDYPFIFGTTSGYFGGVPYSSDDYCVDAGSITEYYCSGDYEQSHIQSCGTDYYGGPFCIGDAIYTNYTDYYCSGGECGFNVSLIFNLSCDSFDQYGDNYCYNDSVYRDFNNSYCMGGECSVSYELDLVEYCDNGCYLGECIQMNDSCTDSDGGLVYDVFGYTFGYYAQQFYNNTDYCLDNVTVVENYCSGVYSLATNYTCDTNETDYCINGRCV